MEYYFLFSTGAIFCTEQKVSYDSKGKSIPCNGYLTTSGRDEHSKSVKNFSFTSEGLVASWTK